MPIYEFLCPDCDLRFETLVPLCACGEPQPCPGCQRRAGRVPSSFAARTGCKSQAAVPGGKRGNRPRIELPAEVPRPNFELGKPPPLPERYKHQILHHGHC